MAMRISSVCDYIVVLFALHSIIRTAYYTNIIYIYIFVMYGTLRSSKVHEILQIINHINYSNVSASSSSDLLGRRLDGDRHEIRP
jgi:hypothetical protein